MNFPDTTSRVTEHTKDDINLCIRQKMEARLFYYAFNPEEIDNRLSELDLNQIESPDEKVRKVLQIVDS